MSKPNKPASPGEWILRVLSSYGLATTILVCLMVLTYFGTVAQIDKDLVQVQAEYFDSWWCVIDLEPYFGWDIGMRFPGALLLLVLLSLNLICGGLVRIRWTLRNAGIIVTHFGVAALLLSGLVTFLTKTNGSMQIDPGEASDEYISFHEWEIAIGEPVRDEKGPRMREYLIPERDLRHGVVLRHPGLPFELRVEKYYRNSQPGIARTQAEGDNVVDGVLMRGADLAEKAGFNVPGAVVRVDTKDRPPQRGILWGQQRHPWTVVADGREFTVDLRRQVFQLPFQLRLEQFHKEEHPGITMPRHFSSDVTRIDDAGREQGYEIRMNEPMRYEGFMFSQNSWGPQDGSPPPYYTVLEVSTNPADQWPKYCCIVIGLGLLFHFGWKLSGYMKRVRLAR